jgi:signal transduction histidine kinase
MSSSHQRANGLLFRTLGRKVSLKGLSHLQPVFLLQTLVGVSQALNGSAAHAELLARALVLDGQRRLSELRNAAPRLNLSLDQLLRMARSDKNREEDLSAEENAIHALLEVCLGLMLQLLSKGSHRSDLSLSSALSVCLFSFFDIPVPLGASPLILRLRARACPILRP